MQYIKDNFLVGSDPELFIWDKYTDKPISAIDKIGGSKDLPLSLGREGFFVQEDNVLAEFNIPPSATEDAFVGNIILGMELLKQRLPSPMFELRPIASAFMPAEEIQDPRAKVFGCDPDFNAWKNGKVNEPPSMEMKTGLLRSAGGHLLAGYSLTDESIMKEDVDMNIIRYCDLYLGVPSVLMDTDTQRKQLYGKSGAYRHKSFGVEYRTLSSFWLGSTNTIRWAYRNFARAIKSAGEGTFIDANTGKRIIAAINNNDKNVAKDLIQEFQLDVC